MTTSTATIPTLRDISVWAAQADILDLAQGVIHAAPPPLFQDILRRINITHESSNYSPPLGISPLRTVLCDMLRRERTDVSLDQIMITTGATGGLIAALQAQCNPGDSVMLFEPAYTAYGAIIDSLGLEAVYCPLTSDFRLDLDCFLTLLPRTKAVIITSPDNPTGMVRTREELEILATSCAAHSALLIIDEVYNEFVWHDPQPSPLAYLESLESVVVLRSFSKSLALAGWRVGYAITSPPRILQMARPHDSFYVGAPRFVQVAIADLLQNPLVVQTFTAQLKVLYQENQIRLSQAFNRVGIKANSPAGAYYLWLKHDRPNDLIAVQELFARGLAVAPGASFYRQGVTSTGYIRAHFAISRAACDKAVTLLTGE